MRTYFVIWVNSSFEKKYILSFTSTLNDLLRRISSAVKPKCYLPSSPFLHVSVRGSSVLTLLTLSVTRTPGSQPGSDDTAADMSKATVLLFTTFVCIGVLQHVSIYLYIHYSIN